MIFLFPRWDMLVPWRVEFKLWLHGPLAEKLLNLRDRLNSKIRWGSDRSNDPIPESVDVEGRKSQI